MPKASILTRDQISVPEMTNAELVALHVRVIALENLLISLLATASDEQLNLARDMAGFISPRSGFTHHPLTVHGEHPSRFFVCPFGWVLENAKPVRFRVFKGKLGLFETN